MKAHEFDSLSFLAGLVVTGIGLTFLLLPELSDIIDAMTDAGSWFWPVVFLGIGIAVLAPLLTRTSDPGDLDEPEEPETNH